MSELIQLAEKWENQARRKWLAAESETDVLSERPTKKRALINSAIVAFNCATELRRTLTSLSPSFPAMTKEQNMSLMPSALARFPLLYSRLFRLWWRLKSHAPSK